MTSAPEERKAESDVKLLQDTSKMLRGSFDTVQIFCTRHDPERGVTVSVHWGDGNHYARRGQVEVWLGGDLIGDDTLPEPPPTDDSG